MGKRSDGAVPSPPTVAAAWALAGYVLAAALLTWPLVLELDAPVALRGDYWINLWNAWWLEASLGRGSSPFFSEWLHHPRGVSLARHTLSPLNAALIGAPAAALGPHAGFNLVLLLHFVAAGFAANRLALELGAGQRGAFLAGLVFSFSPYHLYYVAQINVGSLWLLPLSLWAWLRLLRRGRPRDYAVAVLCAAATALSAAYYSVYGFLLAGGVLLFSRALAPGVEWRVAARRLVVGAATAALAAALAAAPLVAAALGDLGAGNAGGAAADVVQGHRANDLFGFNWIGPPERLIVAWPVMCGYGTLLVCLLGWRGLRRQAFLWTLLAGFGLLGLGAELQVGGAATGIPLPYALVEAVPGLSMLRKADRFFVVALLAGSVLLALAWGTVEQSIRGRRPRRVAWLCAAVALAVELSAVPWRQFEDPGSEALAALAADPGVASVVHLPPSPGAPAEGRYNFAQTLHGKRMPQGYTTSLALTSEHQRRATAWRRADAQLARGRVGPLMALLESEGIDAVVWHKSVPRPRAPRLTGGGLVLAPFRLRSELLFGVRQRGGVEERPREPAAAAIQRRALEGALGPAVHEDDRLAVYRRQ